jgi:hypothetical protein
MQIWLARCLFDETAHFMKKSPIFFLLAGFTLGLLAMYWFREHWSRAQTPRRPLSPIIKVIVNGVEVHTLSLDEQNALVELMQAAGQTNAIEMFREYRCAERTELASTELGKTLTVLKLWREGQQNQAIYDLEQNLSRYASIMCNGYGGLNPTNRERVNLDSLEQTRDYFARFPHPEWGTGEVTAMNWVLSDRQSYEEMTRGAQSRKGQ